ncbi:phosphatase and actin regulator 2 [Trichonephila clavipes]|nr:phosphatase and actin regulator 2 [Trichonephila clavipes]
MDKNALKEDLIRVVEDLDGTVESTDTIAKLKTKIENSSTFESDPDFVKTLIKNCIDERVSRNEREATLEKKKIELAKLQLAQKVNSFESLCDLLISDKLFETLNKETATHIGIREAEDWFRPIDLAKECDIYISSRSGSRKEAPIACGYTEDPFKNRPRNYKPKIKDNYPQYLERQNKNCYICGDSSHYARDCEKRFKPKESHIHNRKNANSLKVKSEKQNSDEFAQLQYVNIFVEIQPVTALIDSGCQIPVLNSSLIRVNKPSEEIITLSSCFGEQRMVEVKPINLSLTQHSPSLSVRTTISQTLTEEFIIHPSVYTEIKKLSHAKSDVLLNEILYKKVNGAMKTSSVSFNSRSPTPSPMKTKHSRFTMLRRLFEPWKWKRKKKSDCFEQTSRTLERKISMRSTKEELNSPSITYTSSSALETYNTVVVTNSGFPTVLSSSQNHAMPVKHNVSLLNLPDVEESLSVPSFLYVSDSPLVSMKKKKRNKYRCGQRTVRLAVVACSKARSPPGIVLATFEKRAEKD